MNSSATGRSGLARSPYTGGIFPVPPRSLAVTASEAEGEEEGVVECRFSLLVSTVDLTRQSLTDDKFSRKVTPFFFLLFLLRR